MNIFHTELYGIFIYIIFIVAALTVSFLFYRNTNVYGFKKAVLTGLRSVSLFFILLLLINPFVNLSGVSNLENTDVILLDNSASLSLENRFENFRTAINEVKKLSGNVRIYSFGNGLLKEIKDSDSLFSYSPVNSYSTDLSKTLEDLFSRTGNFNINSVTIISDGLINHGNNLDDAAKKFGVQFNYILTGDTARKNDLLVSKVFYNRTAFAGSVSTINVLLNSYGYDKTVNVKLYEDDNPVQTKTIVTDKNTSDYYTDFKISSGSAGIKKYRIVIDTLPDEITHKNNVSEFYIKYTDNKFRILVIAGSPGMDYSSFKQEINKIDNFRTDFFVQKSADAFYEGDLPAFDSYDALILIGFPIENTNRTIIENLKKKLAESNIPVIFLNASNTGYGNLKEIENFLPFYISGSDKNIFQSTARILSDNLPDEPESIRKINTLPPVIFTRNSFSPKPGSDVLAVTPGENEPAVLYSNTALHKSSAFLGFGYYKWTLNNSQNSERVLKNLISVLFNLIFKETTGSRFTVRTDKDYYAYSEPVEITALLKDRPLTGNISVRLNLTGKNGSKELNMPEISNSEFGINITPDYESDYTVDTDLLIDGRTAAKDITKFTVGSPREEFLKTQPNDAILKSLSLSTGGKNLRNPGVKNLGSGNKKDVQESYSGKYLLRNSIVFLLIIIFFLSLEWFLRKRFNLP
ncbi:MAG: hypothetical protein PHN88_10540 [Ignavibacteria bacterium]|nr:hypothetical protein [Ignavibacteria bacterium]